MSPSGLARSVRGLLLLTLALCACALRAQQFEYRYISIDAIDLPAGYVFLDPAAVKGGGRLYGVAFDADFNGHPASLTLDGAVVAVPDFGFVLNANERGTMCGALLTDGSFSHFRAALFRDGKAEPIPTQPGEIGSWAISINDGDRALVESWDANNKGTYFIYDKGVMTRLDLGPEADEALTFPRAQINNHGIVAVTVLSSGVQKALRFDAVTGKTTLLQPLAPDQQSLALGVNSRGDVLGFSDDPGPHTNQQRIGTWDKNGQFTVYFTQGSPEHPAHSELVKMNNSGLIVESGVSEAERGTAYLIPRTGVRLNLNERVRDLPAGRHLNQVLDMDENANIVGYSFGPDETFLLQRTGGATASDAAAFQQSSAVTDEVIARRKAYRAAAAAMPHWPDALRRRPTRGD